MVSSVEKLGFRARVTPSRRSPASSSSSRIGAPRHMLCSPCRLASCSTAVISSLVAPALSARRMCRRTPGAYMCVHEASRAMPMSSIVFASSAPATAGVIAIAIAFSVQAGSSLAKGSQSGFQLPVAFLRGWTFASGRTNFSYPLRSCSVVALGGLGIQAVLERGFDVPDAAAVGLVSARREDEHARPRAGRTPAPRTSRTASRRRRTARRRAADRPRARTGCA